MSKSHDDSVTRTERDEWKAIAAKEAVNCNKLEAENDELLAVARMAAAINPFGEPHNSRTKDAAKAAIAKVEESKL